MSEVRRCHWLALARAAAFFTQKSHAAPVARATSWFQEASARRRYFRFPSPAPLPAIK